MSRYLVGNVFPQDTLIEASTWLSLLEIGGSTVSLLTIILAIYNQDILPIYPDIAVFILCLGVTTLLLRRFIKVWMLHAQLAVATVLVSYVLYASNRTDPAVFTAVFFAWIVIYAFSFMPPRHALRHLVLVLLGAAIAFGTGSDITSPLGDWLFISGSAIVTAVFTLRLVTRLADASHTDQLTGLPNRRYVEDRIWPPNSTFGLALIDLDRFKELNDSEGHVAGDSALQRLARDWRREIRTGDTLARWGGDEFLLVMPNSTTSEVLAVLERLFDVSHPLSLSAGFTTASPQTPLDELLRACDKALYRAKARSEDLSKTHALIKVVHLEQY